MVTAMMKRLSMVPWGFLTGPFIFSAILFIIIGVIRNRLKKSNLPLVLGFVAAWAVVIFFVDFSNLK